LKIEGRNAVLEVLNTDKEVDKLYVQTGEKKGSITKIISIAKSKRIVIAEVSKQKLDEMSESRNHQGVIALISEYNYCEVDEILSLAKQRNETPLIMILDELKDPYNFGAIIRSAAAAGVHGIIIPKRRSVMVTSAVAKVAVGALEHVKISKVTNLSKTIGDLKAKGIWIASTDMKGASIYKTDFDLPLAIVIGSEESGVGSAIKKNSDFMLSIPMKNEIESLNASVAASLIMYEVVRQRNV